MFLFPKSERLSSKTRIEVLYERGSDFFLFPIRCKAWVELKTTDVHFQVLVSVSKKRFKHSVDRNRIKRQLKEIIRLNKGSLLSELEGKGRCLYLSVHYIAPRHEPYSRIEASFRKLLPSIVKHAVETDISSVD